MYNTCEHTITINQSDRRDPTRTTTLRNSFARAMTRRFRGLRGVIREAIVDRDCFGLQDSPVRYQRENFSLPGQRQFNFPRSDQKVDAFMNWLNTQEQRGILHTTQTERIGGAINKRWTDTYIHDSYKRGLIRARYELRKANYGVPSLEETGGITASLAEPVHADRLGVLYTRTFNELKGITDAMDQNISRILSQGIADGDNPRLLARKMNQAIKRTGADLGVTDTLGRYIPAERRSRIMARTEIIRAHHQGMIQEYENWRAEEVYVKAEWMTAGDNRVCPHCMSLEGQVFKLSEIRNLIPLHPQCRCIALPIKKER